ncbi:MAG TPA: phosphate ABC transporter permease subunit PstC [Acidimicrobiales bacterium]|nr:phosphate ABC transporter permease subunit PstC [Acidimicrobiales bacterium]
MAAVAPPAPIESDPTVIEGSRGARMDTAFRVVTIVAALAVLVILAFIAVSTVAEAWPVFREAGLSFVTEDNWNPADNQFGGLAFIYGTAVVSAIAILIAVPVSVGIALFTTELAPRRMRTGITMVVDLLAAVPSVVYGLWGIAVLAPNITPLYKNIGSAVSSIPVLNTIFAEGGTGRSYMTAGLIVALMIVPIITSITREVFATVPQGEKDAALALGATRWEMIRGAVFPHSFGGVVGAVMLGLGRAMGETIAIALTIGSAIRISGSVLNSGTAVPEVIVLQWGESSGTYRAALVGLGVLLFALTIFINTLARAVVARAELRMRGA